MKPTTSIRKKLSLAFVLMTLVLGVFAVEAFYTHSNMAQTAARLEARNVANSIAYTGIFNVVDHPEFLRRYVFRLAQLYQRDVVIVDALKRGVADADESETGSIYAHDPKNEVGLTIRDGQIRTFIETNAAHPLGAEQIVVPLRADQARTDSPIIGAVILEYTKIHAELLKGVRKDLVSNFIFSAVFVVFAGMFGLQVATRIAKPLEALKQGVKEIAAGNYEATVPVTSTDEVGVLGDAFNKMGAKLKENHARINEYQRTLEMRVQTERAANSCLELEIIEHAQSEKNLRESEERYRQIVELSPDAICIERKGVVAFANRACAALLGAETCAQIVGMQVADFIHPESPANAQQRKRQVKETKHPTQLLEGKLVRLDGTIIDVEGVAGPFLFEGELATQLLMREITERKEAGR